jgi:hypothetical protein
MADPFTPDTPHLGSDDAEADARDAGRRQDPTGSSGEDRSFADGEEADADADADRRFAGTGGQSPSQQERDQQADTSRDDRQSPLDRNASADIAENLGSNG